MTTYRRYCFTSPFTTEHAYAKALEVLERWCERRWWFTEPQVEGAPFGRLALTFTVAGRDQWWCHRRAMWMVEKVYKAIRLPRPQWPTPEWEVLEPHTKRGRWRRPAAPEECEAQRSADDPESVNTFPGAPTSEMDLNDQL